MKIEITILPEESDSLFAFLLALKGKENEPEEPENLEDILKQFLSSKLS